MKKQIITLTLTAILTCLTTNVFADDNGEKLIQPITIDVNQKIETHDTKFIILPNLMMLDRVVLRMKKSKFCFSKTKVEVNFEGSNRQEVTIQSRDFLNYVVNARTTAREIEVRSVEGCDVTIESATILPRPFKPGNGRIDMGNASNSYAAVSYTYQAFKYLENWVTDQERISYLTPTIKVLGQAMAVLSVSAETSLKAREALVAVANQLNADSIFIEKLLSVETTYPVAVEISSVKAQIEGMLK